MFLTLNPTYPLPRRIGLSDKFGVTNLKIEAEVSFVTSTTIDFDNVMESLQFAVSKNCALLKEAVMDFVVKNSNAIIEKKIMMDAPEGLINDVLAAILREERNSRSSLSGWNNVNAMSICELRRRADAEGLDIGGSREMLISVIRQYEYESESSSSSS